MRAVGGWAVGAVVLGMVLGCSRAAGPTAPAPTSALSLAQATPASVATKPAVPTALPAPTQIATALPSAVPAGRLPAVVAQLDLAAPGGDAYEPMALAVDESGRAVVLCYYGGRTGDVNSALVVIDPAGDRGPVLPLPGRSIGPLASARGRAYLGYEDGQGHEHLLAVDLVTGRILADEQVDLLYYGDTMIADAAGHLFIPVGNELQVRDGTTLALIRSLSLALSATAGSGRAMALDAVGGRLLVASGSQLQAYRTSDLALAWEASTGGPAITRLVLDQGGGQVSASSEDYAGGWAQWRHWAFATESGRALGPLPIADRAELLAADSRAGYLVLAEAEGQRWRIVQTGPDGQPRGPECEVSSQARFFVGSGSRLLLLLGSEHQVQIRDLATLRLLEQVALGIEIRHLVADPARERVYVDDSAGQLHVVSSRDWQVQRSLPAGSGQLLLDAANGLLFVGPAQGGREVTVVDTNALTVTAVITGGDHVAVDSAGRRAFVGWTPQGYGGEQADEVQVWDTRTWQRLNPIAHGGEPAYNPLRDEIYLSDYSAYIVDGKTLRVTGELTPDIGSATIRWCNGCPKVEAITVDPTEDVIAVRVQTLSAGKGPGTLPQPRVFSARTRQPVSHPATILSVGGDGEPVIIPPNGGQVYEGQHYSRYIGLNAALAYRAGSAEPLDYRDGLPLDLYLPDTGVALAFLQPYTLAYDPRTWEPLGWLPYQSIGSVDLAGRRLYAWERSLLTVLSFDGGPALSPQPGEAWPAGQSLGSVREIHLSPDLARDRTVFVVSEAGILRSTDGGGQWTLLHGGLPLSSAWGRPSYHLAVSPAYAQDRTLFVGAQMGDAVGLGVWRSTDGGDSWQPVWRGLQHLKVSQLAISPQYARDRTLLAYCSYDLFWQGQAGQSLFRSDDGGASWRQVAMRPNSGNGPPLPAPEELLPPLTSPVRLRAAAEGNGVDRSADGGKTWQTVLRRTEAGKYLLAVLPSPRFDEDRQAFALFQDLLYRSTDGGLTWQSATDRQWVREGFEQYYTALAVGQGEGGKVLVYVGDASGAVTALDPGLAHWGGTAPTPVALASPVPGASATPCPGADPPFSQVYPRWQVALGCPMGRVGETAMAVQEFEHGRMFWRSDTHQIYVLTDGAQGRRWSAFPDTWQEGQPDRDPALVPPAGLEQPIRGFGKVWREQLGGPQAGVGWARGAEQGYGGRWQEFAGGMLLVGPEGRCYALLADGRYESEQ